MTRPRAALQVALRSMRHALPAFLLLPLSCSAETTPTPSSACGACESSAGSSASSETDGAVLCPEGGCEGACDDHVRYPRDRTHSPLPCVVAERLRALSAIDPSLREDTFMKVGDSISATHEFLHCFETEDVNLSATGHGALEAVRQQFLVGRIDDKSPFTRQSLATRVGMTARWALDGSLPPVEQEKRAATPRYALVMFGTNDVQFGGPTAAADMKYEFMARNMRELIDWHLERGIAPVLYSIPPYDGAYAAIRQVVPSYNAILRALAEHRLIPFVDYYREMVGLPNQGLRDDGVHPSADYVRLCNFDESGLQLGYNVRNLLTLQALDRLWSVTRAESPRRALDERGAPPLPGRGSAEDPFVIDGMPFGDMRQPSRGGFPASLSGACEAGAGDVRRVSYRVVLEQATPLRLVAIGFENARVRITTAHGEAPTCPSQRALVEATFPAGSHEIHLDVVRPAGGEAVLMVDRCADDDERCL